MWRVLTAAVAAVLLVAAPASQAAFPGRAGRIVLVTDEAQGRRETLVTMNPDGTDVRRLSPRDSRVAEFDAAYSPEGTRLAFVRSVASRQATMVAEADGGGARRILRAGRYPAWSPDGAEIAVARGRELWLTRATGSRPRRLTRLGFSITGLAWSPRGAAILIAGRPLDNIWVSCCLYTIDPRGRKLRRILAMPPTSMVADPVWSPDGRQIAFTEFRQCVDAEGCGSSFVATMNSDGSEKRVLADGIHPAWSPDGTTILYEAAEARGRAIYALSLRERTSAIVTPTRPTYAIDWQPLCTIAGGASFDRLLGSLGDDVVCGHAGDDRISGMAGRDRLFGHGGNDVIHAADGVFDVIGCGPGHDRVVADRSDRVALDCERVGRRESRRS